MGVTGTFSALRVKGAQYILFLGPAIALVFLYCKRLLLLEFTGNSAAPEFVLLFASYFCLVCTCAILCTYRNNGEVVVSIFLLLALSQFGIPFLSYIYYVCAVFVNVADGIISSVVTQGQYYIIHVHIGSSVQLAQRCVHAFMQTYPELSGKTDASRLLALTLDYHIDQVNVELRRYAAELKAEQL